MKKFLILILTIIMSCTVSYAGVDVPETVKIKLNKGSIVELALDEYLYGVVSSEMGTSYKDNGERKEVGIEALKAQAVASRTYAVYKIQSNKNDGYDMTATTSDQVYKTDGIKDIVKEAVDATSGQIMTYDDEVICAYFFSTSGGYTEEPQNVWSASLPYLKAVEDPYEPQIEGKSEWEARISADKYGEIEILELNENGRVQKLKVGNKVYTKNNIRMELGTSLIKSTYFELEYDETTNEYVFKGKGFGHGVGMSQHGAMGMAEAGFDYREILEWYYTDIELEPNGDQYIIVDGEENLEEDDEIDDIVEDDLVKEEINETSKEDNEINEVENNYGNSKVEIDGNKIVTEKGPMLKKLLEVIEKLCAWR